MSDNRVTALVPVLVQGIERVGPASLFAAGPAALLAARQWAQDGGRLMTAPAPLALPASRVELAVVDAGTYAGDREDLLRTVVQLRDCLAGALLLAVPADAPPCGWQPADGYALGLRLESRVAAAPPQLVFSFALATYKPAPEWLNSKYWAHPERFDAPDADTC